MYVVYPPMFLKIYRCKYLAYMDVSTTQLGTWVGNLTKVFKVFTNICCLIGLVTSSLLSISSRAGTHSNT